MTRIFRTLAYALLVIAVLSYLSYLLYFAPGQLERRAAAALARHVATEPLVQGASQRWMGPLFIRRVLVPASPVLEERDLLVLYDLEVEDAGEDWARMGLGTGRPLGHSIRVRRAELCLDHELAPDPAGGVFSQSVWNCRDVLRGLERLGEPARAGHRVWVDELRLALSEVRRRREKASWTAAVEDLSVEGAGDGTILLRGDLVPGQYWSEGQFQARLRPEPQGGEPLLEAQGSVDDLHGLDEWIALLFPEHRRVQELLAPRGPVVVTVNSFRLFPAGGGQGARAGRADYQALIRHYDSVLRLPGEVEVRHLTGTMAVEPGQVVLGEAEGGLREAALSGEVWGTAVELRGRLGPTGARVEVLLGATDLKNAAVGALPEPLASLWRRLRPSGILSGELDLRPAAGSRSDWSARGAFRGLALDDLPFLGPLTGVLSVSSEAGQGRGTISISSGRCEPLGSLEGELGLTFSSREISLEPTRLTIGGGALLGKLIWERARGALAGSLSWDRSALSYSGGLLAASAVGGRVEITAERGRLGGSVRLGLQGVTLRRDRLPQAGFPLGDEETLGFKEGEVTAVLTSEALRPLELALRGETCALRLRGSIGYRGGLDAVAVLAVGEPARALNLLGPGSAPRDWRRAVDDHALALRVLGDAEHVRIRRVEWSDPTFHPQAGKKKEAVGPPAPPGAER